MRQHARPTEASSFDNLVKTAQRAIDNNSGDFESHLDDLRSRNFMILWRQDWFVIERFKWLAEDTYLFPDAREHAQLVAAGAEFLTALYGGYFGAGLGIIVRRLRVVFSWSGPLP